MGLCKYSGIPISRTLNFANLPITRTKSRFPSSVKHCSFTPDFSNYSIFLTNFRFPWKFVKSGFHCRCLFKFISYFLIYVPEYYLYIASLLAQEAPLNVYNIYIYFFSFKSFLILLYYFSLALTLIVKPHVCCDWYLNKDFSLLLQLRQGLYQKFSIHHSHTISFSFYLCSVT